MKPFELEYRTFDEMVGEFPETVYKYRRWNNKFDKRVITHGELYFASPREFEDKEDCKQTVRFEKLSTEEKIAWIEHGVKTQKQKENKNWSDKTIKERALKIYENAPIRDSKKAKEVTEKILQKYFDITGVLSLAFNSSSVRMWNEYAENHQGFCVGFDSKLLFESKIAGKGGYVDYVEELPKIYPEPIMDFQTQANLQIFSKLKKWDYEEEYRLHMIRDHKLEINDRRKYPPAEAFKEIIIGKNMAEEDFEELKESLPDELSHVKIIRL